MLQFCHHHFACSARLGKLVLGLLLVVLFSQPALALKTKQDQMIALDTVLAELKTHYGMAKFKEKTFGVTFDGLRNKYARLIRQAKTLEEDLGWDQPQKREILPPEEFRQLLIGMIAELRDAHVNISRQTSEVATVGVMGVAVGEKLIVTRVSQQLIISESSAVEILPGDEVVEVDGVPVLEHVKRNLIYESGGTYDDRFQGAMSSVLVNAHATHRPKKEGEKSILKFKRGTTEFTAHLRWTYTSDFNLLLSRFPKHLATPLQRASVEDMAVPYGFKGTVRSYFKNGLLKLGNLPMVDVGAILNQDIAKAQRAAQMHAIDPSQNPPPPANLAKITPVSRLSAYMIRYRDKNIGVIRIPSYSPPGGFSQVVVEYRWMAEALRRLEGLSDVLIFDQLSNPGGSVYYVSRLLGLFAHQNQPMQTPLIDYKLNYTYLNLLTPSSGNDPIYDAPSTHAEHKLYEKYYREVKERFENGEEWTGLTPGFHLQTPSLEGEPGAIFPAIEGTFSKPILLLNDRMSGSGGDFMPAQLQFNQRALVMGETSCGMGGPVYRSIDSLPGSELSLRCTFGYAEMPNGWPIENIGVVPDIPRSIAVDDIKDGFASYAMMALDQAYQLSIGQPPSFEAKLTALAEAYQKTDGLTLSEYVKLIRSFTAQIKKFLNENGNSDAIEKYFSEHIISIHATLREDIILRTLWEKKDVANRLREMKSLPKWQKDKAAIQAINALIELSEVTQSNIQFAEPCAVRLMMTPLKPKN